MCVFDLDPYRQRDGMRLRPSRRLITTIDHEGRVQFALASVTIRDAGLYTCTASNAVGLCKTTCQVTVHPADFVQDALPAVSVTPNIPLVQYLSYYSDVKLIL